VHIRKILEQLGAKLARWFGRHILGVIATGKQLQGTLDKLRGLVKLDKYKWLYMLYEQKERTDMLTL
jgi:hypothetical protein